MIGWKVLLDHLPAGVAVFDFSGKLVYVNERILQKTGASKDEVFANPRSFVHPEDLPRVVEAIRAAIEGRSVPYPLLARFVARHGWQWNEVRIVEVTSEDRRYILCVFTDVTERVRLQEKVQRLLNYVRFLNRMLRHDVLNVMSRILAYAELLLEIPEARGFAEKIMKNVESGVELINRVRALESAVEERVPVDLREIAESVVESFDVNAVIEGNAVAIANDGIYSVFENIVGNAVKHGKAKNIWIRMRMNSEKAVVEISDDGVGIPEELRGKIFDEGFSTGSGSGLGLYIAKTLIENYGGKIEFRERKPRGSTFVIELPSA